MNSRRFAFANFFDTGTSLARLDVSAWAPFLPRLAVLNEIIARTWQFVVRVRQKQEECRD